MSKLIGLTGKARSGKDTVGNYLAKKEFTTYAMASPIKEACRVIFDWNDRHLHGDLKEVIDEMYEVTPREAMQKLGTEFGRDMINTRLWELRATKEIQTTPNLVVTDIRFDNEAELIIKNGGFVMNIEREMRNEIKGIGGHQSETGVSQKLITHNVNNNGSLKELYQRIDEILNQEEAA